MDNNTVDAAQQCRSLRQCRRRLCNSSLRRKKYILAAELVENVLGEDTTELARFKGSQLVGIHYKPLFDFPVNHKGRDAWRIVSDDYVTLTDGAGIVHLAPAFGEDDARVGRKWELPFVQLVDARGRLTGGTPWDGTFVKEADKPIIADLKARERLLRELPYEHSYPFCWRCDTPLIYYARESWFVKTTAVRDRLIENNKKINWIPESIGEGRMGNFLENVIDWGISRERYWGTPLPVWMCPDCGHYHVMGSRAELRKYAPDTPEDIELHKPMLDPITFKCENAAERCTASPLLSTAGSTAAQCLLHSGTIRLKTKRNSSAASPRIISAKPLTKPAVGSIR